MLLATVIRQNDRADWQRELAGSRRSTDVPGHRLYTPLQGHAYKGVLEIAPVGAPSARAKASTRQAGAFAIFGIAPGMKDLIS